MNPSATGWIAKFLAHFEQPEVDLAGIDNITFYNRLKGTGFIYGASVATLPKGPNSDLRLTQLEYTKINLFHALLFTCMQHEKAVSFEAAINEIIRFYKSIDKGKTGFLQKLTLNKSPMGSLEKILSSRLQENNSITKNKSTNLLTYALLYVDILQFRKFMDSPDELWEYSDTLESAIVTTALLALQSKERKNKYDEQLLELVRDSSDYVQHRSHLDPIEALESISYLDTTDILEKKYLLDVALLAVWDDHTMDRREHQFLEQLAVTLDLEVFEMEQAVTDLVSFSQEHAKKISLFEFTHPVRQFYNQSAATVKLLILRNKNRLVKELDQSGELVLLLGQSTVRELTSEEKNKVREQLLDICKTIPSLTIFLLPGGTVLLPLLMKFIPKLLPSSFHDNRLEKK